jgi:hypothetical protein
MIAHAEADFSQVARLSRRWLSPTLFALIGLCFLLPFATVSCDGASTSFTGVQLVTRAVPHGGVLHEAPDCSADIGTCVEQQGSLTAQVALAFAILGFAFGLLGVVRGPGWCAAITLGALVTLALQPFDVGPDVTLHSGMELALVLGLWATALHAWRTWRRRHRRGGFEDRLPEATPTARNQGQP